MTPRDLEAATQPSLPQLVDTDTGRYGLATHTARYVLDLDARRLLRIPRTAVVDSPDASAPAGTVVFLFDVDGGWVDLVELEHCAVGDRMQLRADINGQTQPWCTTAVLRIDRIDTPAERSSSATARYDIAEEP